MISPKSEDSQSWREWGSSDVKCGLVCNWSKCKPAKMIKSPYIDWSTYKHKFFSNRENSFQGVFKSWRKRKITTFGQHLSSVTSIIQLSYKYNPAFGIIVRGFDLVPITFPSSRISSNREHVFDQPASSVQWRGSHKSAAKPSRLADPAHIVQRGQNQGPKVQTVHPWWNIGISWRFHQDVQHSVHCKSFILYKL